MKEAITFGCVLAAACAGAAQVEQGPAFTVIEENDLVVKTDRDYTQGIRLSYMHTDNRLPGFARAISEFLPEVAFEKEIDKVGLVIGQTIFTPEDTDNPALILGDRPYAGWLYTGLVLQRRGSFSYGISMLEQFQLELGIVGPESLAEQAQTWVHEIRGFDLPQGWDNQIDTEPGLILSYLRSWRVPLAGKEARYVDALPHFGLSLGNVDTSFRVGGMLRAGLNLPRDHGPQTISSLLVTEGGLPLDSDTRKRRQLGGYLFASVEGWGVARNMFLDGNLFRDSHSVTRETWVAEGKAGWVLVVRNFELGSMVVARTPEYAEQGTEHHYGSVFLKLRW